MKPRIPIMLFAATICIGTTQAQQDTGIRKKGTETTLSVTTNRQDGVGETRIDYTENGQRYKMRLDGSKILEMTLNGNPVPEADFAKYDSLVKKILAQVEKDREQAEKDRAQAELGRVQAQRNREQAEAARKQADNDRLQAEADRKQSEKDRVQAELDRKQAEKDRAQAQLDREQAAKHRAQAEEDRKLMDALVDELVDEKVIGRRSDLTSLELSDARLMVNGKEQPEMLHNRLKAKYLKSKNNVVRFTSSNDSRHLSVE